MKEWKQKEAERFFFKSSILPKNKKKVEREGDGDTSGSRWQQINPERRGK